MITVALACLRYLWVWVSLKLMLFYTRRRSGGEAADEAEMEVDRRVVPVMSLAGVRGAVTLAGVLSLPLMLVAENVTPEQQSIFLTARTQAIFLAAMVILISLVAASVLLPRLLRGQAMRVPDVSAEERREEDALRQAATAAIKAVEEASHEAAAGESELYAQAALRVIKTYKYRLADEPYVVDEGQSLRDADRIELKLRQTALKAERDTIAHLAQTQDRFSVRRPPSSRSASLRRMSACSTWRTS